MIKKYTAVVAFVLAPVILLLYSTFTSPVTVSRTLPEVKPPPSADQVYFSQKNFRTVSFGTSRTYGAFLKNPAEEAFAGLLNGANKGIRSSNSDYPAMCTYSMLGDEIYDVITIEYMPLEYKDLHESLIELGTRLRKRFPDAMIIYINIWSNHQFHKNGKGLYTLSKHLKKHPSWKEKPGLVDHIVDGSEEEEWSFIVTDEAWLRNAVKDPTINGTVLHYDLPQEGQYRTAIRDLAKLYLDDVTHFSIEGHEWIAQQVMKMLHEAKHQRSDRVNPWEEKDQCLNWIQTGKTELGANMTNMPLESFSNGTKFALEASNTDVNWIALDNNSSNSQHLYLTHMATSPDDIYGSATIEIHNQGLREPAMTVAHAETHMTWSVYPVHVMKHQYIGELPQGRSFVVVRGNETKTGKEIFRTIGVIMTPKYSGNPLHGNLS